MRILRANQLSRLAAGVNHGIGHIDFERPASDALAWIEWTRIVDWMLWQGSPKHTMNRQLRLRRALPKQEPQSLLRAEERIIEAVSTSCRHANSSDRRRTTWFG
jgi:hypothetical protein